MILEYNRFNIFVTGVKFVSQILFGEGNKRRRRRRRRRRTHIL
jgi:hypothetical protein